MKKQSIGIVHWLIMILFTVMCLLILIMTASRITGIAVDRFLWAEEASRYLMIWMSFLAAVLAARSNSHFRMTALTGSIRSPAVRRAVEALAVLCSVLIMAVILYYGYHLIVRQIRSGQSSPVMLIPMWATYLAIPVSFAGMLVWTVVNGVRAFRAGAAAKNTEEKQ